MLLARFRLPLVTASSTGPGYAGYARTTCGIPHKRHTYATMALDAVIDPKI
jgi:hypothetical protein